jgi:para-aminobenzoate synthetase component I
MFWPSTIFVHDRPARTLDLVTLSHDGGMSLRHYRARTGLPWDIASESVPHSPIGRAVPLLGQQPQAPTSNDPPCELRSSFTQDQYLDAVSRIRRYIRNGDVYQVNLSQRFEFPVEGNPFHFWRTLFSLNPAPFYSYIQAGSHQVLSTSMERFLYLKDRKLETRPIKGTRKRGKTPEEDQELKTELADSPKDDAELSMIVDLLRNDLGRVCEPRSIRVADHKRLEAYTNVHHLVSTVTGILRPDVTYGDLVRATFPGGSITGCPKIRAMEIIDELEPISRHVYTGSIGYLGWHGNLDLNIAIRTAVVRQGRGVLSVGGGVVYDSDPQDEYEETLHKGRTFLKLLGRP